MQARINIHFQNAPTRQLYLDESCEYIIGRADDCDIIIDDPEISRQHAKLSFDASAWSITDLGSKNGVAINGNGVTQSALTSSVWINLGEQAIRFDLRTAQQVAREVQDQRQRYETSIEIRRSLKPSAGVRPLLNKVLNSVLQLTATARGFAMLAGPEGDMHVLCASGLSLDLKDIAFSGSVGAVEHALSSQQNVVLMDVQQFAPLSERPSVIAGDIRALLCLPMQVLNRTIGVIYADSNTAGKVFTELDLEILAGLISHAAMALAVAQLDVEISDLDLALRDGEVNASSLDRWRDSIPGYRHRLAHRTARYKGSVNWSQIAANPR